MKAVLKNSEISDTLEELASQIATDCPDGPSLALEVHDQANLDEAAGARRQIREGSLDGIAWRPGHGLRARDLDRPLADGELDGGLARAGRRDRIILPQPAYRQAQAPA